jgi:hypothetical protein
MECGLLSMGFDGTDLVSPPLFPGPQASMQGLTNLSMRWLNYPAKMLFKSSRIIPTMIVGVLYMKKSYKVRSHIRDVQGIRSHALSVEGRSTTRSG